VRIVGRQLLVGERPVFLHAFYGPLAEVTLRESKAVGVPVDTSAAHGANPVDENLVALLVANRLAYLGRISGFRGAAQPRAAIRQFVGPSVEVAVLGGHQAARFDQRHLGAALRELFRQHSTRRPRTDHADVTARQSRNQIKKASRFL